MGNLQLHFEENGPAEAEVFIRSTLTTPWTGIKRPTHRPHVHLMLFISACCKSSGMVCVERYSEFPFDLEGHNPHLLFTF